MPPAHTTWIALLLTAALPLCLAAQQAPDARSAPVLKPRKAAESRIRFPFRCESKGGTRCGALLAQDVRVFVDGKAVNGSEVSLRDAPNELILVLDGLNTSLEDLVRSRNTVAAFLTAALPGVPVTVVLVTDTRPRFRGEQPANVSGWELLKNQLYVARIGNGGEGERVESIAASLLLWEPSLPRISSAQAEAGGSERVRDSLQSLSFLAAAVKNDPALKTVAWISPGWPSVHLTQSGLAGQVFDSIVYFDDALRGSGLVLSALDPTGAATDRAVTGDGPAPTGRNTLQHAANLGGTEGYFGSRAYRGFLKPAKTARDADPNDMLLPVLAVHSGGLVETNTNDLRGGLQRVAARAGSLLELSLPAGVVQGKGAYHTLRLEVTRPGMRTEAAEGFYVR